MYILNIRVARFWWGVVCGRSILMYRGFASELPGALEFVFMYRGFASQLPAALACFGCTEALLVSPRHPIMLGGLPRNPHTQSFKLKGAQQPRPLSFAPRTPHPKSGRAHTLHYKHKY